MTKELADTLPPEPVDQHVVVYWSTYNNSLCCVRLTYHVYTRWSDHPWSKQYADSERGSDFVDEWAMETAYDQDKFSSAGRVTGWDIRDRLAQSHNHKSITQAAKYLYDKAASKISRLRTEIAALEQAQNELKELL